MDGDTQPIWIAPRDGSRIMLHLANAPEGHDRWVGYWAKPDEHAPDGCWMLTSYGKCDYEIIGWSME